MMDDEQRAQMVANMARAQRRIWSSLTEEQREARRQRIASGMQNKWQPPPGYEDLYEELRAKRISMREVRRIIEDHIAVVERRQRRAAEQQNGGAHAVDSEKRQGKNEERQHTGEEKEVEQNSKQRPEDGQE